MIDNIGLQLYSLRDAAQKDYVKMLEDVAAIGYKYIEFAGYGGLSSKEMKAHLDRLGLRAVGAHIGIDRLTNAFSEEVEFNKTVGNDFIICPYYGMKTKEDALTAAKDFNAMADKCAIEGMTFGYHNHAFEFEKTEDGEYLMEVLIANTSPLVKLELDVYWVEFAGLNAVSFIKKHADRIELLHLKELSAERTNVEIGTGILDFKAIIAAGKAAGVSFNIVEQEQYTVEPLESVKICFDNLQKL